MKIENWKLVPVEPTEEMLNRAYKAQVFSAGFGPDISPTQDRKKYSAMLAVAPEPDEDTIHRWFRAAINAAGSRMLAAAPAPDDAVAEAAIEVMALAIAQERSARLPPHKQRLPDTRPADVTMQIARLDARAALNALTRLQTDE